jgi:hypothetical protein
MEQASAAGAPAAPDQPTPEEQQQAIRTGGIVGLIGGALLFISLFLPWYKDDLSEANPLARAFAKGHEETYNAFQGLERTDIGLAVLAGLAIVAAVVALARLVKSPGLVGLALTALGVAAAGALLLRASDAPSPNQEHGIPASLQPLFYLAVAASIVIIAGGLIALRKRTRRPPEEWEDEGGAPQPSG